MKGRSRVGVLFVMRSSKLLILSLLFSISAGRAPDRAAAEDAAASAKPSSRAGADASTTATADASAPKPKVEPNLLDLVPSKVAVSSTVQNPRDFPEHLVDGRADTAWNGKTGDLVGGFIAFRVPKDARVRRIEMTAGYDKVKGALDLFTANHRITKVALSRDGKKLSEHRLDPNVRGMQSIPVDGPGGDYEIRVLATIPGTKPEWKELVVSELRVVGDPGKDRRKTKEAVRVVVGGLDEEPPALPVEEIPNDRILGPVPGIAELCDAYLRKVDGMRKDLEEEAKMHDLTLHGPSCAEAPLKAPFIGDGTYKRLRAVRASDGISTGTHLVAELARGLVMLPVSWAWDDPLDPGCPSIVRLRGIKSARVENGHLVVVTDGETMRFDDQGKGFTVTALGAVWCRDERSKLLCRSYDAQYQAPLGAFAIAPDGSLRRQD
jgi:hypothetical protein